MPLPHRTAQALGAYKTPFQKYHGIDSGRDHGVPCCSAITLLRYHHPPLLLLCFRRAYSYLSLISISACVRSVSILSGQEAIKKTVLSKYPHNNINVAVALSPDLAIVQGAAHYVVLERPKAQYPTASGATAPQYPVAPHYGSISSPNSYGILVAHVREREGRAAPSRGCGLCVAVQRLVICSHQAI